ncbi:MAG: hypothetical protein K0U84_16505 [Actinomycetia bacterium]|nr:hypothetical protein [Actinomycetes bacterium]
MGRGPIGDVAVSSAATDSVVAANVADQSVSIFDPAARPVGDTVAVAGESVAVTTTDDRAYVAYSSANHDAVSAIDLETRAIVATFPMDFSVTALAASPDGKRVYAGLRAHDRVAVTVIDTVAEQVRTIDIGYGPAASLDALYVDPSGKRLYAAVTDDSGSRLVIVSRKTSKVQRVVVVGSPIRDIAHASDSVYVLTSDRTVGGAVHVIDLSTNGVTDTLIIGGAPTQLVMSPDQARAYIVDYDRVAVLCTLSLKIVDSLFLDERPSCVALGSDGSSLYVADYDGGVYKFSVESTIEKLYSHLLATDPGALNVPRVLEPVTA